MPISSYNALSMDIPPRHNAGAPEYLAVIRRLRAWINRPPSFLWAIFFSLTIILISGLGLLLLWFYPGGAYRPVYYQYGWVGATLNCLGWLVLIGSLALRFGFHPKNLKQKTGLFRAAGLSFAALMGLLLLVSLTGWGITPDWGKDYPGVPLLEWQIWAGFLVGAGLWIFTPYLNRWSRTRPSANPQTQSRSPISRSISALGARWGVDVLICLLLWGLAVTLWSNHTIDIFRSSYFAPVRPPNYEPYPYSDAGFYDYIAQGVLLGEGYLGGQITTRPLYIFLLVILHALFGQDYFQVIFGQTLVLALFPVILYFLGKNFHSRPAGVIIGLWAALREYNTIAVTPLIGISNSQLFMTDLPTALGICLFALALIKWLKEPGESLLKPLVTGGVFGLLMLLRYQSLVLLAAALLLSLLVYSLRWRKWLPAVALLCLGSLLVVTPWLWRNWYNTGKIALEQSFETSWFSARYNFPNSEKPVRLPGESDTAYDDRLQQIAREFIIQHPGYTAWFIGNHFLSNEINTLLVLPVRIPQFESWRHFFDPTRIFWMDLNNGFSLELFPLVILYLFILAAGIGASWQRWHWAGLLPLVINVFYSLSTAIARFSGWRLILPVDWVGYFYFGIGLLEILGLIFSLFGHKLHEPAYIGNITAPELPTTEKKKNNSKKMLAIAAGFLLAGLVLPISEKVFPRHFPPATTSSILANLISQPVARKIPIDLAALPPNILVQRGRVFYPRYYPSEQGEYSGNPWPAYAARPYPRLSFMLINQQIWHVVLPLAVMPAQFPNAADATIIGCQEQGYLKASLVVLDDQVFSSSPDPINCGAK